MLSDASCGSVFIGFESIVPELQAEVTKRFSRKAALDAIKKCIKNGIKVKGNFIFNLPGANVATFEEDVSFILELKRLGVDNIQASYLKLHPGADFFDKYQWHTEMNVQHDQMSYRNFQKAKSEDRRILFAYLFSDERLPFCDISALSVREIVGCLVEFFPFTLGYMKDAGCSIWEVVKSMYSKEPDFFDTYQYNDYELWSHIFNQLQSVSVGDMCLYQMLMYEGAIGELSLRVDANSAEIVIDLDVERYMASGQIALHKEPKKYVFLRDNHSLTIEEKLYE